MRLGIDLGTTRTVVAVEDRGNYPVVCFTADDGDLAPHVPTLTADAGGRLVHGHEAEIAARAGAPVLRSWKRLLAGATVGDRVRIGSVETSLLEVVTGFLAALRHDLFTRSNLPPGLADPLEAVVSVPANAHSTQRFFTLEAFRRAGFAVRAVVNEPSAAGIEYAHRHGRTITSRREHVVVYDLGGGTFDAALVHMGERGEPAPGGRKHATNGRHDIVTTNGVSRLGGDDFDEALLETALEIAGVARASVSEHEAEMLEQCRIAKEAVAPTSRRIAVDLSCAGIEEPVVVDVAAYYERARPLVDATIDALAPVLASRPGGAPLEREGDADASDASADDVAGLYVVGGASALPLVARVLRERFGRRVHRSPHPSAAIAIGLAIAAAERDAPELTERLTRHLGVFRERESGARIAFDGIVPKDTALARDGKLAVVRTYRPVHNVGHFRFVECGELDPAGEPSGDITPHAELLFPYEPRLRNAVDLGDVRVERLSSHGPLIEERYEIDGAGVVAVTITDLEGGYQRSYVL